MQACCSPEIFSNLAFEESSFKVFMKRAPKETDSEKKKVTRIILPCL